MEGEEETKLIQGLGDLDEDGEPASVGAASPQEGAEGQVPPAEGAGGDPAGDQLQDGAAADEEGGDTPGIPALTEAQIESLATDPRFRQKVLGEGVDSIVDQILSEKENQRIVAQQQEETQKTIEEALQAAEEGDLEPIGELAVKAYKEAKAQRELAKQIEPAVFKQLDDAISTAYADITDSVDEGALQKAFQENGLAGVMSVLRETDRKLASQGLEGAVTASQEAARNVAAAAAARDAGVPVLPGGAANAESIADIDDVGALMRKGMEEALTETEE